MNQQDKIYQLEAHNRALVEALREIMDAEWMVTNDWGGDRVAVFKKAEQALSIPPDVSLYRKEQG